jgi:hypothetical protein
VRVIATRSGVHASDEPEPFALTIHDWTLAGDILRRAADRSWLPSIQGGRATWSIASNDVLAVLAYEWPDLKLMPFLDERMKTADRRQGALRLHFNYHTQIDPETAYRLFYTLRLRASPPP